MKRVAKPEGKFNVVLEDAPGPAVGPHDVRVRNVRSLISRGSELWRRYIRPEAVDPQIMGYSVAGVVDAVGAEVEGFAPGDRVGVSGPHAQFVVQDSRVASPSDGPRIVRIPDGLDFEQATFLPLTTSSVMWIDNDDIQPDDMVVIVGQGLVGSLLLQVARANGRGRLVAVDALPNRCALAAEVEADEVINASDVDPVARVLELTNGRGADVVIYAVGGRAGLRAFDQAQRMTETGGLLQVVGLYEDDPLPRSSSLDPAQTPYWRSTARQRPGGGFRAFPGTSRPGPYRHRSDGDTPVSLPAGARGLPLPARPSGSGAWGADYLGRMRPNADP